MSGDVGTLKTGDVLKFPFYASGTDITAIALVLSVAVWRDGDCWQTGTLLVCDVKQQSCQVDDTFTFRNVPAEMILARGRAWTS